LVHYLVQNAGAASAPICDTATELVARLRGLMETVTTLVLVRHGETAGNREGRFQTYDTPLSPAGRAQAARLAERLAADATFDALYSSDLRRTMETAEIVGERLGLQPTPEVALRELDVGDWKGQLRTDVLDHASGGFEAWVLAGGLDRLPGAEGECSEDVSRRARSSIDAIVQRHRGELLLVVSHGLTLAILLAELQGWDRAETLRERRAPQGNTAVNVLEVDDTGTWRCLLLGCVAHLDQPPVATRAL